jgi:hypothetical protein
VSVSLIQNHIRGHTQAKGNQVSQASINAVNGNTILDGLQGVNAHLAMINSRLETLLLSDLPEYVMADLVRVYQAEQEASQIVHSLNIYCHKNM